MMFQIKRYLSNADVYLLLLSCAAAAVGLVLIFSATLSEETNRYMIVQSAAVGLGVLLFIIFSLIDINHISVLWKWLYIANLLLICSLLIFGVNGGTGNRSWIRFAGIGIQPAEIGKVLLIFTFAQHIRILSKNISSVSSVLQLCIHFLIIAGAVYICSKDLGMVLAYAFIAGVMMFAAGVDIRWFALAAAMLAIAFPVIWNGLGEFQRNRILVVLNPEIDSDTAWHAEQSKIALGSGGITGQGYLNGRQTQYSRLPEKHTDFIFSVAGEEFGFIGCIVIIVLLMSIVLRILYVSSRTDDIFSYMVCIGIGAMILFQIIINIGMCVQLTPVIGLTLPFISYGGSSVVTMFISTGIVCGICMRVKPSWLKGEEDDIASAWKNN